jgi:hypothetical protein
MTTEDVIEKVQKLLRLAESSNPHEAASAAARAQELLFKHKLEMADVMSANPDEPKFVVEDHEIATLGRSATWKEILLGGVAGVNGCRVYRTRHRRLGETRLHVIGGTADIQATTYIFNYLCLECEKFLTEAATRRGRVSKSEGRVWANNFKIGFVEIVTARMWEQKHAREQLAKETQSTAMVLVNDQKDQVDEFFKNMKLKEKKDQNSFLRDTDARLAGRDAGREVTLAGNGKQLGESAKPLKGE